MKPKNLVIVRAVTDQGLTHTEAAAHYGVTRHMALVIVHPYRGAMGRELSHTHTCSAGRSHRSMATRGRS
ncbi:hypothetical protein WDU99_14895 [Microbacterium sp. Mu-80]|uniref:Uncharacterized protein n=1 Tax=Microbacterium bandirmense TaxID=3122050 RepID=A0ABU8LEM4_9MICO